LTVGQLGGTSKSQFLKPKGSDLVVYIPIRRTRQPDLLPIAAKEIRGFLQDVTSLW
jgi:hypothetical protein